MDSEQEDNGCPNCDYSIIRRFELDCGIDVYGCLECGRAEIDNSSQPGVELHKTRRYRDENGQFIAAEEAEA